MSVLSPMWVTTRDAQLNTARLALRRDFVEIAPASGTPVKVPRQFIQAIGSETEQAALSTIYVSNPSPAVQNNSLLISTGIRLNLGEERAFTARSKVYPISK